MEIDYSRTRKDIERLTEIVHKHGRVLDNITTILEKVLDKISDIDPHDTGRP